MGPRETRLQYIKAKAFIKLNLKANEKKIKVKYCPLL